jgi:RNA polymerase sigma-70 factor, ECF subfamily
MLMCAVNPPETYDDPLVARFRSEPRAALAQAYDVHNARVRAFAKKLTGSEAQAEDLVQETFIALPRAMASFEGRSKLSTFLLSIAYNLARKHIRSAARKRAVIAKYKDEPREEALDGVRNAGRSELAGQLLLALDTLPEDQRAAFTLMELEEYTSPEVAEILGIPEGTVRTRLFHAKRKLREELEGWRPR